MTSSDDPKNREEATVSRAAVSPQRGLHVVHATRIPLDTTLSPRVYAVEWGCANDLDGLGLAIAEIEDNWHEVRAVVEADGRCTLVEGDDGPVLWIEAADV